MKGRVLDLFILLIHLGLLIVSIVELNPFHIAAHSILLILHLYVHRNHNRP